MPCDGSYLEADNFERNAARVACLLGELDGGTWSQAWWAGYHPDVYNRGRDQAWLDAQVAKLCGRLQHADVKSYSLEMQIWWRDHQAADAKRAEVK